MVWIIRFLTVVAAVTFGFSLFYGSPLQMFLTATNTVCLIVLTKNWE